jgi:hypothetical protein
VIARMTRASMLEVIRQDYIRTARANGLREWVVIYKHALKNAMIPVITVFGLEFGYMLGGAVLTETVSRFPVWAFDGGGHLPAGLPCRAGRHAAGGDHLCAGEPSDGHAYALFRPKDPLEDDL